MPGLHKVLGKMLHYRYLIDRVLNMPFVPKWQGYREFCVSFILDIVGTLNMP